MARLQREKEKARAAITQAAAATVKAAAAAQSSHLVQPPQLPHATAPPSSTHKRKRDDERDREKSRDRDRHHEKTKKRDKDRERDRDREKERDQERDRHRERDKDEDRDKDKDRDSKHKKKKKKLSSTSKDHKKDTKLYCICKTPYDESKYARHQPSPAHQTSLMPVVVVKVAFFSQVLHRLRPVLQLVPWRMCRHHGERSQEVGGLCVQRLQAQPGRRLQRGAVLHLPDAVR